MEFWKSALLPVTTRGVDFTLNYKRTLAAHGFVETDLGGDGVCLYFFFLSFFLLF
jgi:hypothetical protein